MKCQSCGRKIKDPTLGYCQYCGEPIPGQSHNQDATHIDAVAINPPKDTSTTIKKYLPFAIIGCAGLSFITLVAVIAAVFILRGGSLPFSLGSGSHTLIAFQNRNSTFDLYLLKMKQDQDKGILLAEDASLANAYAWREQGITNESLSDYQLGGFIPGTDRIIYWYNEDDSLQMNTVKSSGNDARTILESSEMYAYAWIPKEKNDTAMVVEPKNNEYRCYVSTKWEEATRLGKGENCFFPSNGKFMIVSEVKSNETTLTRIDVASGKETILLNSEPDISWYQLSSDGVHIAYLKNDDESQMVVIDTKDGNLVWESENYQNISNFAFTPSGDDFALIANKGRANSELIVVYQNEERSIAKSLHIDMHFSEDGKYLLYQSMDDDGEVTLYSYAMAKDSNIEIMNADATLSIGQLPGEKGFYVYDSSNNNASLYSVDENGENLRELYKRRNASIQVLYQKGKTNLYIIETNQEGFSLLLITGSKAEEINVLDEWASFQLLNISPNGKTLIIKGKPDTNDNWALYAVDLEGKDTPDELDDDADDYLNAVFNKNNNEVIFTAKTGTNNDDVEIAIKNINNRDRAEVLYEEAILESVEWAELTPFQVLSLWSDMSN